MPLPSFTSKTDGVDDVLASHVNDIQTEILAIAKGVGLADYVNTETLAATKTFTDTDGPLQYLDPGGASRDVNLPAEASTNNPFVIVNTADAAENLVVKSDAPATIITIGQNQIGYLWSNGVVWRGAVLTKSGSRNNGTFEARLTLETGVPVSTSDQTAKTTVYLTPYKGNQISLYDGSAWGLHDLTEISVAVPSTTVTPFDIFVYDNAGTLTLEAVNWINDTTRATALALQDGVYVKTGTLTKRYVGTGRTTGVSGQTEDSVLNRLLWNYYNRVERIIRVTEATDYWSVAAGTALRSWNNSTANRVNFIIGIQEATIYLHFLGLHSVAVSGGTANVGIGLDATNAMAAGSIYPGSNSSPTILTIAIAIFRSKVAIGFHFLQLLEYANAANNTTFYGDVGVPTLLQSGAVGYVEG